MSKAAYGHVARVARSDAGIRKDSHAAFTRCLRPTVFALSIALAKF